jgi:hypothetical protein
MKVFAVFLLGVFFMSTLTRPSDRPPRAIPLLVVCAVVAFMLSTVRFVS